MNNGGPAFPSHGTMGEVVEDGMTLRDYFAAHATERDIIEHQHYYANRVAMTRTREDARWRFADAMLAAREEARPSANI